MTERPKTWGEVKQGCASWAELKRRYRTYGDLIGPRPREQGKPKRDS